MRLLFYFLIINKQALVISKNAFDFFIFELEFNNLQLTNCNIYFTLLEQRISVNVCLL